MQKHARHFAIGAAVGLSVTLFVLAAWSSLYSESRWPGYERVAAARTHEYNSSPLARNHAVAVFTAAGLLLGLWGSSSQELVWAWLGLSVALLLSFLVRPAAWGSNLAPLALVLYPVQALPFLLASLLSRLVRRVLKSRAA